MADPSHPTRPNILLIITDQQRGDCLGINGHPVLLTPNLDALAAAGVRFTNCYSTCPSCIPARRSLLSGQFPSSHRMVGFQGGVEWSPPATLPGQLSQAGYQTALVGRTMHQHPQRKRFGYDHMVLIDDFDTTELDGDLPHRFDPLTAHGIVGNGWTARPWHLDESLHPTTRTATEAVRFLRKWRDPSCPFFLTVSFWSPHPPLTPPAFYMDRYLRLDLPQPVIGDWACPPAKNGVGADVDSDIVHLTGETLRSCRAAYYGLINHIDDQIARILQAMGHDAPSGGPTLENTIIIFTSDHGEMLGDHYLYRKTYPYQASVRVPLFVRAPEKFGLQSASVRDEAVCLEDIMPTALAFAAVAKSDSVDGLSLLPLLRGEGDGWRPWLHGEHAPCYRSEQGNHFLTDGREKYIWFSQTGREQLFDLITDPDECHDLAGQSEQAARLTLWRDRLIERLKGRPEGFTDGRVLIAGRPHTPMMPAGPN